MADKGPKARDRIIGARLRAMRRERADLALEAAAELAGWSSARLSRSERGLRHVTTEEVATLLTVYKIPASEREEILAEMQAGSSSGWWDRMLPGVPSEVGALASYEADANELVDVALMAVPGLLHTYETAVGVMAANGSKPDDSEMRWMARLRRQQILGKVDYTAYISEVALHIPYGGTDVLRGQLEHLLRAQDRGIGVRIIPANQTLVMLLHSWLWMRFPNTTPVVHVELARGAFYLHNKDVAPYETALERLSRMALAQTESRKLIAKVMKEL